MKLLTYLAHAEATDNPLAKKVLIDIANEERVHAGEFARLISILTEDEDDFLEQGAQEVDEMASSLSKQEGENSAAENKESTIGSLRE